MTDASTMDAPRASPISTSRILLGLGLISSAIAWYLIAPPVLTFATAAKHAGHFPMAFAHVLGGTLMLFLGLANLYVGTTRRHFQHHKLIGRVYLAGGAFGALSAVAITASSAHKSTAVVFTNATISLLLLAFAWLAAASMAWRAVRNRRFDAHRDWMIRSYVLAWSFVFCRLASRVPGVEGMGGGEAFIWLSWVGPLLVCEVALQWSRGSRVTPGVARPAITPRPES